MAKHALYLVELGEDYSEARLAEALRRCSPIVDRDAVRSAALGQVELPVLVAQAELKAQLLIISKLLESGGCKVCLVEDSEAVSLGTRFAGWMTAARRIPGGAREALSQIVRETSGQVHRIRGFFADRGGAPGVPGAVSRETNESVEDQPRASVRLKPFALALRVAGIVLLVAAGAALLLLIPRPASRVTVTEEPHEIGMLPGSQPRSLQASSGGSSAGAMPGVRDAAEPDPSSEGDESTDSEDAAADNDQPMIMPSIALREGTDEAPPEQRASQIDLGALILGFALAWSTWLLLPGRRGAPHASSAQIVGVAATAALAALVWATFFRTPETPSSDGGAGFVLTGTEDRRASPEDDELEVAGTGDDGPERPFEAFVAALGGEPSGCSPELPRFEGLLCELRAMGATTPQPAPEDALAAAMGVGDDDSSDGDDDSGDDDSGDDDSGDSGDDPVRALDAAHETDPATAAEPPPTDSIPGDEGDAGAPTEEDGAATTEAETPEDGKHRTVRIPGSGSTEPTGRSASEEGDEAPGGGSPSYTGEALGGDASSGEGGGEAIDRVEIGGGASSVAPPRERLPLRTRLTWLVFGLVSGWFLLGFGWSFILGKG